MTEGYTLSKNIIAESELTRIWMDLHLLIVKQLEYLKIKYTVNMKKNLELLLNADTGRYLSTLLVASRLKSVLDIFYQFFPMGPYATFSPVLHVMANSLKIPGGYWGTKAHQDWPSTQGSLVLSTVWIPITNTYKNFPLEISPGSHRRGLLDGVVNGSVFEVEASGEFVPVDAGFGDAVTMSGFLVHRTGKGDDGLRVAVSMRFENVNEDTFIARGYPCAQRRVVDRDIGWKPSREQIDAVD